MSTAPGLDPVRPAPRRRPPLALVPPRRPAPATVLGRTPFVALVVSLLVGGLLGLLVLNTALAQDAFRLHTLKQESRALEDREEALLREVEALRAPQELAARATALGMVQAGPPAFLRLSDGTVLGADVPAEVPELSVAERAVDPDVPTAQAPAEPTDAGQAPEVAAAEATAEQEGEPAEQAAEPADETADGTADGDTADGDASDGDASDGDASDAEDGQ